MIKILTKKDRREAAKRLAANQYILDDLRTICHSKPFGISKEILEDCINHLEENQIVAGEILGGLGFQHGDVERWHLHLINRSTNNE